MIIKAGLKNGSVFFKSRVADNESQTDSEETGAALKA
jgi:hypothetical protein